VIVVLEDVQWADVPTRELAEAVLELTDRAGLAFVLSTFLFAVVGVLVAARNPGNPVGWILLAIGATWGLDLVCSSYATYGLELHRGSHDLAVMTASIGTSKLATRTAGALGSFETAVRTSCGPRRPFARGTTRSSISIR
jgi:hypothetical protein